MSPRKFTVVSIRPVPFADNKRQGRAQEDVASAGAGHSAWQETVSEDVPMLQYVAAWCTR